MVLRGHSGGALVDACSGDLLGIVTSHAKLNEEVIIHRLNFSVSVEPVREMISFAKTGSDMHLDEIRRWDASEAEMKIWRLETKGMLSGNVLLYWLAFRVFTTTTFNVLL